MKFLCTPSALRFAGETHTHWLIAMAQQIDFPTEPFQVWEFKRDIEPGMSAVIVTDGDERELHKMTRSNDEFLVVSQHAMPGNASYWVVRSHDEDGHGLRTLLRPEDY